MRRTAADSSGVRPPACRSPGRPSVGGWQSRAPGVYHWKGRAPVPATRLRRQPMPAARSVVVLVEDEELIRRLLERVLESAEYEVLVAPNGEVALRLIQGRAGELSLLLTDLVMPGMSGLELARAARELQPELPVLCMSGYS